MFERSRIDNAPEASAVPVEMTFADSTTAKGKISVPTSRTIGDASSTAAAAWSSSRRMLASDHCRQGGACVGRAVRVPKLPNLQMPVRDIDGFDPHAILGMFAEHHGKRSAALVCASPRSITPNATLRPSCLPKPSSICWRWPAASTRPTPRSMLEQKKAGSTAGANLRLPGRSTSCSRHPKVPCRIARNDR